MWWRVVAAAAVVSGCALIGAPAEAAPGSGSYVDTVPEIVAALEKEPVLVEQTMGSGVAEESHDRLAALAQDLPFPTYVALVDQPLDLQSDGLAGAVATALHRQIGIDGLYYVDIRGVGTDVETFGLDLQSFDVTGASGVAQHDLVQRIRATTGRGEPTYLLPSPVMSAEITLRSAALPGVEDFAFDVDEDLDLADLGGSPSLPASTVAELARQPWAFQDRDVDDTGSRDESHVGERVMIGTTVGLLLAAVVQTTLRRRWPGWQPQFEQGSARGRPSGRQKGRPAASAKSVVKAAERQRPPTVFDPDDVRRSARAAIDVLAQRVSELPAATSRREAADDAVAAREAAGLLVESTDPRDVLGALVLTGRRAADRLGSPGPRRTALLRGRRRLGPHRLRLARRPPGHPGAARAGRAMSRVPTSSRSSRRGMSAPAALAIAVLVGVVAGVLAGLFGVRGQDDLPPPGDRVRAMIAGLQKDPFYVAPELSGRLTDTQREAVSDALGEAEAPSYLIYGASTSDAGYYLDSDALDQVMAGVGDGRYAFVDDLLTETTSGRGMSDVDVDGDVLAARPDAALLAYARAMAAAPEEAEFRFDYYDGPLGGAVAGMLLAFLGFIGLSVVIGLVGRLRPAALRRGSTARAGRSS